MTNEEKCFEYADLLVRLIGSLFEEDSEYEIDQEELFSGNNLTNFIHALATVAPNSIFNKLTGEDKKNLEFNHLANQLCFQYMNKAD